MRSDVILYNDAKEIALSRNSNYNKYQEYKDAFFFFLDDGIEREGGDAGIVILKDRGELMMPYEYFMSNRSIKEIGAEQFIADDC